MSVFCSNTLILAPECSKCILRDPNFQNFPGGMPLDPPRGSRLTALGNRAFGAICHLSADSSTFATYSNSYWKPCSIARNESSVRRRTYILRWVENMTKILSEKLAFDWVVRRLAQGCKLRVLVSFRTHLRTALFLAVQILFRVEHEKMYKNALVLLGDWSGMKKWTLLGVKESLGHAQVGLFKAFN